MTWRTQTKTNQKYLSACRCAPQSVRRWQGNGDAAAAREAGVVERARACVMVAAMGGEGR